MKILDQAKDGKFKLKYATPVGAFYVLVDIGSCIGKQSSKTHTVLDSCVTFCRVLLEEEKVALTPGGAFFAPGTVRVSYSTDFKTVEAATRRFTDFVSKLIDQS